MVKFRTSSFVATRNISFPRDGFHTVGCHAFPTDGWHSVGDDLLCNNYVDDGADLVAFLVEAAGDATETIDYKGLLKCHVVDGVVKSIYTPGIMGDSGKLMLVSGDNRFQIFYNADDETLLLGNLKGKTVENKYKKADGTEGKSVAVVFTPVDVNLKVTYEIPFIMRKWDELKDLLEEGTEISKELFDWLLAENSVESVSTLLMQTLGNGEDRKKLYELGCGRWKVLSWEKTKVAADSKYPPNYLLTLATFEGQKIEGAYYTTTSITKALNSMGAYFESQKAKGREFQLLITEIRPYNDSFAVTGAIQLVPEVVPEPQQMRSAAVEARQLPQGNATRVQNAAEFMRTLNPIDVPLAPVAPLAEVAQEEVNKAAALTADDSGAVTIEANAVTSDTTATSENGEKKEDDPDYDPIPF